jgi:proteasome assembly chaperone (PAC2) family protein
MTTYVRLEADLPQLRDPILIVAFGGAWGASAVAALEELVERWGGTPLATIDSAPFYDFSVRRPTVRVTDGTRTLSWPENRFVLVRPEGARRDAVLLLGSEPHLQWAQYVDAVVEVMEALGVRDSLILGAFRAPTPHSRPVPLRAYATDEDYAQSLSLDSEPWEYEGPASVGTLLGVRCEERGWRTAGLIAAGPFYVSAEPLPHLVRALADSIAALLGVEVELHEVDERIVEMNAKAEEARASSEEFADFIEELEEQYDDQEDALAAVDTAITAPAPELLSDIDAFLREHRDSDAL